MMAESSSPDEVLADYKHRLNLLLDTYWPAAVAGEHKSAELCCKLLQQHAALNGIDGKSLPTPSTKGDDELAKLRSRRASA